MVSNRKTRVEIPITLADLRDGSLETVAWERDILSPNFTGTTELIAFDWNNDDQSGIAIFILTERE